jgi:hypothetical protein
MVAGAGSRPAAEFILLPERMEVGDLACLTKCQRFEIAVRMVFDAGPA